MALYGSVVPDQVPVLGDLLGAVADGQTPDVLVGGAYGAGAPAGEAEIPCQVGGVAHDDLVLKGAVRRNGTALSAFLGICLGAFAGLLRAFLWSSLLRSRLAGCPAAVSRGGISIAAGGQAKGHGGSQQKCK